jgi:hypothetical protein
VNRQNVMGWGECVKAIKEGEKKRKKEKKEKKILM